MKWQTNRRERSPGDQPERHPRQAHWGRGYLQGLQMGACLFLLCNLPDFLIINLTTSAGGGLIMWWYLLTSGILVACWAILVLKIGSGSTRDTPQAYGLVTMLLFWLIEQALFFLLAKQHG